MASSQSSSSYSQSTGFSGINDPEALAALKTLIDQLQSGGTAAMKEQATAKKAGIDQINAALGDYKKSAAFQDALDLVTASLDKAMLAQKPAITRAVQGAGTSASSMQGLLAQNAAEAAATQAGALGAEQSKAYGQITASLLNTLMSATSSSDPAVGELLKALDLTRVSQQQSTSSSQSQGVSTDGGGGSSGGSRAASGGGGGTRTGTGGQSTGGLFDDYNPMTYSNTGSQGQWASFAGDNNYDWNTGTHGDNFPDSNGSYTWEVNPASNTQTSLGSQDTYDWGTIPSSSGGSSEWNNPYIDSSSAVYEPPSYDWNSYDVGSVDEWVNPYY